ncbi:MAG: squalene-hopene/tetraprenyl-beta-curcumene cyclase [Limisphaerales bacterium]|jgi:squalene-hopene/tetraprenyl-beta-curcumene cyclase
MKTEQSTHTPRNFIPLVGVLTSLLCHSAIAAEPVNKYAAEKGDYQYNSEGIQVPAATPDEPKVKSFGPESVRAARKYLDDGAHHWVREKTCVACHSTGTYMAERPILTPLLGPPSKEVWQDFIDDIPKKVSKPRLRNGSKYFGGSIKTVWRGLGLATWDRHVTGKLSTHTDTALRQTLGCLADEGFIMTFPQVEIPHITSNFELTVQAARSVATAPGWLDSVKDEETLRRIKLLKGWLREYKPNSDYERAVKLQLATFMPELVTAKEKSAAVAMLWRQQLPDGGWSTRRMSDLMKWHEIMDEKVVAMIRAEPDAANPASDAYLTAFAIVRLREAGIPATDKRIQKGIRWLKQNQRVSGRWWMKSLFRPTFHYITYISTAQALRALALCDELPKLAD